MGLAVGMVVDDRYLLEQQIGAGGMARVFRATNRKNGRRVAVKEVYIPENDSADTLRGWFQREIRALMVLDHPNVLQLIDHGETTEGAPFVVTELLEGKDLEDWLTSRGPVPDGALVNIALQALAAFELAHGMSIVHRDIKPGNLYLCYTGRVVVLDFGLARATTPEVSATLAQGHGTKILGTPQYWSPEQLKGVILDPASDIFSLGGTLYFLASGQPPYVGKTPFEIASLIMMKKRPPLVEVAPRMDPVLASLIEMMLAEETRDRPNAQWLMGCFQQLKQTFVRYHDDLLDYIGGGAPKATPAPAPKSAPAPSPAPGPTSGWSTSEASSATPAERSDPLAVTAEDVVSGSAPGPPTPNFVESLDTMISKVGSSVNQTSIVTVQSATGPATLPPQTSGTRSRGTLIAAGVAGVAIIVLVVVLTLRPTPSETAQVAPAESPAAPPSESPAATAKRDSDALPTPNAPVDVPVVPAELPAHTEDRNEAPRNEAPKPEAPRPATGPGTLNCQLKQWAEVIVDGQSLGKKQIGAKIPLAPGKHDVVFKNAKFGERHATFAIKAGRETPCKVDFENSLP